MIIIQNIVIFLVEIIKSVLLSIVLWNADFQIRKKTVLGIIIPLLFYLILIHIFGNSAKAVLSIPVVFISMGMIFELKFIYIFISWNMMTLIDTMIGSVLGLYLNVDMGYMDNTFSYTIIANSVLAIFLIVLVYIKKRSKWSKQHYKVNRNMSLALAIEAIAVGCLVTIISLYGFTGYDITIRRIGNIVVIITGIIVCVSMVAYMSLATKNFHLNAEMEMKEVIMNQQKQYYVAMLEKDENARKFRHDIRGHISSIRGYLACEDYQNLKEYVEDMDNKLKELSVKIPTGNHVVNAIVSDITSQYDMAEIEWNGKLSNEMNIKMMDLCTIFYNLLNNACREVNQQENKRVTVDIKYLEPAIMIEVSNHTDNDVIIDKNYFVQKEYENGHGYGLKNVKECVEKNGGEFEIVCSDNTFSAKIILQNAVA